MAADPIAQSVRFGVIGLGVMGQQHARKIARAADKELRLAAVADANGAAARQAGQELSVPSFADAQQLLSSGLVDAVVIAAPHYLHAPLAIQAARAGIHVLCEKPLAVEIGAARAMVDECRRHRVSLGIMLQSRRRQVMMRLKQMIERGELGQIYQATLICSNWYRTQAYYDSGSWRGTWAGEGGGILTNQAPHHLDLLQWFLGRPRRVAAFLSTRLHHIEVENTANVLLEYDDGKSAYLYFTTAESPCREQLVICGDKGTAQVEGAQLHFAPLAEPLSVHIHTCRENAADHIAAPASAWQPVAVEPDAPDLRFQVIQAFARHITYGEPMVATGEEGADQVELANAIYLAGFGRQVVDLPLDDKQVRRWLDNQVQGHHQAGRPNFHHLAVQQLQALGYDPCCTEGPRSRHELAAAQK